MFLSGLLLHSDTVYGSMLMGMSRCVPGTTLLRGGMGSVSSLFSACPSLEGSHRAVWRSFLGRWWGRSFLLLERVILWEVTWLFPCGGPFLPWGGVGRCLLCRGLSSFGVLRVWGSWRFHFLWRSKSSVRPRLVHRLRFLLRVDRCFPSLCATQA